jgi:hypothetical protein
MKVLEFSESSAISKISIDSETNQVGVAFTSNPDSFYIFNCDDVEDFEDQIQKQESIGRFVSLARKDGTLIAI